MAERNGHLPIGEVLLLLKEEFPDVTISKIRFLESQGLINPVRTPSGYRKFFEPDIRRLEWVLRQQRDHFLPLKVIKAKLDQGQAEADEPGQQPLWPAEGLDQIVDATPGESPGVADADATVDGGAAAAPAEAPSSGRSRSSVTGPRPGGTHPSTQPAGDAEKPLAWLEKLQESPLGRRSAASSGGTAPTGRTARTGPRLAPPTGPRCTLEEVATKAGVAPELVADLVEFGLLRGAQVAGETLFDAGAVEIAAAASRFAARGVEARHLRLYKLAVDRESGFIEQLILPLLKQRNPEAKGRAAEALSEYVEMGDELRRALLQQALGDHLA